MTQQQEQNYHNRSQLHQESHADCSELRNALIAAEAESEKYRQRVIQLFSIAKSQAIEIGTERRKRKRTEKKLRRSRIRLKKSDQDKHEWMRKARSINSQLNSLQRRIKRSETTSQDTVQTASNTHKDQALHAPSETENQIETKNDLERTKCELEKAKDELKRLKQAQRDVESNNKDRPDKQMIEERNKRRRAQKEYKRTKQKLRHTSRELNFLRREHNKCGKKSSLSSSNGRAHSYQLADSLLPNLILVHDSAKHLRISEYATQIFVGLRKLNNDPKSVRSERVGSAEPWLEMKPSPTRTERIYYQKSDSGYLVLLGDKNSQDKDIKWMKINQRGGL